MSFFVSERKSEADCLRHLNTHVPRGVFGGIATVPAQTFGSVTPATGVMVTSALGSGDWGSRTKSPEFHDVANAVTLVTAIVFPRVHDGNFAGEIVSVSV